MTPTSVPARSVNWLWPPMYLLALVTATVAWWFVALVTGRPAGWMAVLAALELAFMLRLGALRTMPLRIALTLAGVLLVAVAAQWSIVSTYVGGSLGLGPWDSIMRMGPYMAWTLVQLGNGLAEVVWVGIALVVGWFVAR